jgi:hypothetical protein
MHKAARTSIRRQRGAGRFSRRRKRTSEPVADLQGRLTAPGDNSSSGGDSSQSWKRHLSLEKLHMPRNRQRRSSINGDADLQARSRSRSKGRGTPGSVRPRNRFADPWSFRRAEPIEHAAGLDGRPLDGSTVRRGGRLVHVPSVPDPLVPQPLNRPERSMLAELWRRVAGEIARYRMSGLFSLKELRTIEALWLEGISLRALARREGVAAQAVEDRIERLKNRAPRFYLWWRLKNRTRARR